MKKVNTILAAAAAILTLLCGCRKESDEVIGVGLYPTEQNVKTYSQIWEILWKGFNQNYVGWEMEDFDWDEVRKVYTPKFLSIDEKLETLKKETSFPDDKYDEIAAEADSLFREVFCRFKDGHAYIQYVDYATGERKGFATCTARVLQREDVNDHVEMEKNYYHTSTDDFREQDIRLVSVSSIICQKIADMLPELESEYLRLKGLEELDILQTELLSALENCLPYYREMKEVMENDPFSAPDVYFKYEMVKKAKGGHWLETAYDVPSTHFGDDSTSKLVMGTTKDNIVYYRIDRFAIPDYEALELENPLKDITDLDREVYNTYYTALTQLHDKVYQMHRDGTLKGIILDVRDCPGGRASDLKWVAGMFYKGKKYEAGTMKMKNGLGRLDYTVPLPLYMDCYGTNEEDIDEPMVILTNAQSASCSEVTTASVKQHPNGISIGMTTWGGGNKLIADATYNSIIGYAGCIGIMDESPVFVYMPYVLASYYGLGVIDAVGIAPDIEIRYDADLYESTGRDNQFERALSYIREGK